MCIKGCGLRGLKDRSHADDNNPPPILRDIFYVLQTLVLTKIYYQGVTLFPPTCATNSVYCRGAIFPPACVKNSAYSRLWHSPKTHYLLYHRPLTASAQQQYLFARCHLPFISITFIIPNVILIQHINLITTYFTINYYFQLLLNDQFKINN